MTTLADVLKVSFGGDRSAAGRYAAEQRWKGHVKRAEREPSGFVGRPLVREEESHLRKDQLIDELNRDALKLFDDNPNLHDQLPRHTPKMYQADIERRDLAILAKMVVMRDLARGLSEYATDPAKIEILQRAATEILSLRPSQTRRGAPSDLLEQVVDSVLQAWASSTQTPTSLELSAAAARVFGYPTAFTDYLGEEVGGGGQTGFAVRALMDDLVRQMHANTQAYFKAKGIKEVTVYRGQTGGKDGPQSQTVMLRPLTSWSLDPDTANQFGNAKGGIVASARVPVTRLLSVPFTGVGCLGEAEMVVIGAESIRVVISEPDREEE